MTDRRADICNLLGYAKEMLRITEKVVSDLSRHAIERFHERDLDPLEGMSADETGDVWLRIARLRETPPPAHDPVFDGWITGLGPVAEPPRLADKRVPSRSTRRPTSSNRASRWRPTSWPSAATAPTR